MPDLSEYTRKWRPMRHIWPIVAAACLGLAVAAAAWLAVSVWEERLARTKFNNVAGDYASGLQNGLDDYLSKIVAVRAFYDPSHAVDLNEFEHFTGRILEGDDAIMRITWSPRVTGDERAEFERKVRDEGIQGYQIRAWATGGTPGAAPQEKEYFPVLYSTGIPTALSVLGIDLNAEPMRRQALEHARDGDRMSAAPDVELRHDGGGDWRGFFVALPVYRPDLSHATIEDRRRNLLGILGGTFQTAAVIDSILAAATLPQDVDLYLFQAGAGAGPDARPVYTRISPEHNEPVEVKSQGQLAEMPHWFAPLKAGDASWKLVAVPMQGGLISFYRAWLVFAGVILMFAAVLAYMWASLRHALRLETAK